MTERPKAVQDYIRRITTKGGKARAKALTAVRRREIATQAAKAKWKRERAKHRTG